jgi:tryptophanyl-tRNA synthetase
MVNVECRRAGIGCVEDKKLMADNLVQMLAPFQQRRRAFEEKPQQVWDVLEEGSRRASVTARETMDSVRAAMNLKTPVAAKL